MEEGFRRGVSRRRERGQRGDSRGHVGEARGARWGRLRRRDGDGCFVNGEEKARERRRGERGVGAVERATWRLSSAIRGKRQAAGAVASSVGSRCPSCRPGEKEAVGWHGPSQCWAARWAGWVFIQVSPFLSLFLFFIYSVLCFEIVKILFHLEKA